MRGGRGWPRRSASACSSSFSSGLLETPHSQTQSYPTHGEDIHVCMTTTCMEHVRVYYVRVFFPLPITPPTSTSEKIVWPARLGVRVVWCEGGVE